MGKLLKIVVIIILVLAFGGVVAFAGIGYEESWYKIRVAHSNLYGINKYIDYASEVYFDVETYPDMEEMGLFWTRWDEDAKEIVQVPADSEAGAALIDPSKPTIINVHGVLGDGHYKQEAFNLNSKITVPADYDIDAENVSMNYLWIREGWNVGNFHYNRFVTESDPSLIEARIWSKEGAEGLRYRHTDGSYSPNDPTEYSLAEHFAAEYLRAMNLLPNNMGQKEIRVAAHSMGGQLATAGIFLLTELAADGQLKFTQLPNRFALLDPYFSVRIKSGSSYLYLGPENINIRWSGKQIVDNYTGRMMIHCLKDMHANGIVLEYYANDESFLKAGMLELVEELRTISTYTIVFPNYNSLSLDPNNQYTVTMDGHNGVREWYMVSMLADPIKDITNGNNSGEFAPSASLPTEKLKELKGKAYTLVEGTSTVKADDDLMIRRYSIYYELNDGTNATQNREFYTTRTNTVILHAPRKTNYVFAGWYTTPDFSGESITTINISLKKDIKVYAKWIPAD